MKTRKYSTNKKPSSYRAGASRANARFTMVKQRVMGGISRMGPPATQRASIGEVKSLDIGILTAAPGGAALACNTTGSIIPLNLVQAGSSFFNRIGRKIEMRTVEFQGTFGATANTATNGPYTMRVAIIYDRQTNGATPSLADIFQDTEQNGTNTTAAESGLNLNNRDRFSVIMDKRIMLPGASNSSGTVTNVYPNSFGGVDGETTGFGLIHEYRKLGGLLTHYKADSSPSVIGDVATGGLFLVTFATLVAGLECWTIKDWKVRMRFTDI